ncbi:unnamed protein product [Ilex paraguariensis]|uniref:Uncharacterized protein n=1 Tax=Ilex paraguariensis TaxID=185542 RepID=A0ABC8TAM6_9AQUA
MVGKGQRRREKNYRAAHGANSRLPPPPDRSSLDAVPSKLRQIMAFTGSSKGSVDVKRNKRGDGGVNGNGDKKLRSEDEYVSKSNGIKREVTGGNLMPQHMDHGDKIVGNNMLEKKKKKRKRKQAEDLRFETVEGLCGSKRREHKKQRLEAMKKKHKKVKAGEDLDFPGRDLIKFGEVVEAPPKLLSFPKASKATHDASQERLRLQAVENYRKRKGWTSRPGIHLPPPMITSPSL